MSRPEQKLVCVPRETPSVHTSHASSSACVAEGMWGGGEGTPPWGRCGRSRMCIFVLCDGHVGGDVVIALETAS